MLSIKALGLLLLPSSCSVESYYPPLYPHQNFGSAWSWSRFQLLVVEWLGEEYQRGVHQKVENFLTDKNLVTRGKREVNTARLFLITENIVNLSWTIERCTVLWIDHVVTTCFRPISICHKQAPIWSVEESIHCLFLIVKSNYIDNWNLTPPTPRSPCAVMSYSYTCHKLFFLCHKNTMSFRTIKITMFLLRKKPGKRSALGNLCLFSKIL